MTVGATVRRPKLAGEQQTIPADEKLLYSATPENINIKQPWPMSRLGVYCLCQTNYPDPVDISKLDSFDKVRAIADCENVSWTSTSPPVLAPKRGMALLPFRAH